MLRKCVYVKQLRNLFQYNFVINFKVYEIQKDRYKTFWLNKRRLISE